MNIFARCMPAALPDPIKNPGKPSPLRKLAEAAPRAFNMILSMLTIFDLFALSLVSEKWKRLVHAYHTAVPDNALQCIRLIATTKTEKISITRNEEDKEFWIWEFDSSFNFFNSVFSPSVPVLESLICWKEETEDDAEANGTITRHTLKVRTAEWKAIEKLLEHMFSIFEFRSKIIYFDLDWQSFGTIGFLDSMKQHGFDTYSYQGRNEVEWFLRRILTEQEPTKNLYFDCTTSKEFRFKIEQLNVENHFHVEQSRGIAIGEVLQLMDKGTKQICLHGTSFGKFEFKILVVTLRNMELPKWKKLNLELNKEINVFNCFEDEEILSIKTPTDRNAVIETKTLYTFPLQTDNNYISSDNVGFHIKREDGTIMTATLFGRYFACVYLQDSDAELLSIISSLDHTIDDLHFEYDSLV
ncbi:hypothetical protein CAEBREN_10164 [Caenorhabditis brenneri]|uniref:F-box domain-containing protein n=1 Tax=Caenorhabditis brenneri TaxID=135651 RepID=G0NFB9_CAEBE|nr:hypothetical protein CAEBREN_10164 [Caenorhabditis brenneri]